MYACAYTVYKLQVNNNVFICIHSAGKFKVAILIPLDKYKLYYYMYFILFCYQTWFYDDFACNSNLSDKIIFPNVRRPWDIQFLF